MDQGRPEFTQLYDAYYLRILNYLYRGTLDIDTAEYLTSNTFFKALRAFATLRPDSSPRAWLYGIAANELRMYWRQIHRRRRHEHAWATQTARLHLSEDAVEGLALREQNHRRFADLHRHLLSLPQRHRTALTLRFFEQLTYEEIAQATGKRVGTIKSWIHRGLKQLRNRMEAAT
ncbi:MAG: RNA polymerase sigma factor [Phycisphaeraceae bacterium]|nr:RNA polymerase sigma factor [Phycisphaeraceae bacterium]